MNEICSGSFACSSQASGHLSQKIFIQAGCLNDSEYDCWTISALTLLLSQG